MELHVIEQFLQLAKMEHMTETADFFNITQPSLSKNIARLEDEVGVKLFDRVGRRIRLNKNGENFAEYAREALNLLQAGKVSARTTRYEVQGRISICCRAFGPILSDCVSEYLDLNPMVEIHMSSNNSVVGDQDLDDQDFILCATNPEAHVGNSRQIWESLPLFSEGSSVIISAASPFLHGNVPAAIADLKTIPFVTMLQSDIFFKDLTFLICLDAGFTPRINLRTDNFMVKLEHVKSGKGAAVLPDSCLAAARAVIPDLIEIPIRKDGKDYSRTVSLMHRKEAYMTETALDFLEFAKNYFHAV